MNVNLVLESALSHRQSDREDLLREATALVERAELRLAESAEPIIVGFRRDHSASFYFGVDPVYQFNAALDLRRAYIGGLLYKAERGRLVALRRERNEAEVALFRMELNDDQTAAVLTALRSALTTLNEALDSGSYTVVGQVPAAADVVFRIQKWLAALPAQIALAQTPNVR